MIIKDITKKQILTTDATVLLKKIFSNKIDKRLKLLLFLN